MSFEHATAAALPFFDATCGHKDRDAAVQPFLHGSASPTLTRRANRFIPHTPKLSATHPLL